MIYINSGLASTAKIMLTISIIISAILIIDVVKTAIQEKKPFRIFIEEMIEIIISVTAINVVIWFFTLN